MDIQLKRARAVIELGRLFVKSPNPVISGRALRQSLSGIAPTLLEQREVVDMLVPTYAEHSGADSSDDYFRPTLRGLIDSYPPTREIISMTLDFFRKKSKRELDFRGFTWDELFAFFVTRMGEPEDAEDYKQLAVIHVLDVAELSSAWYGSHWGVPAAIEQLLEIRDADALLAWKENPSRAQATSPAKTSAVPSQQSGEDDISVFLKYVHDWQRSPGVERRSLLSCQVIASALNWDPERLNEVVEGLEEKRWLVVDESLGSVPYATHALRLSREAVRAFEKERAAPAQAEATPSEPDKRTVFVVHGRNTRARDALFQFLRAIGLRPLEWTQAISLTQTASPYIGMVLDKGFSVAQAVVVLMTGDDEAQLRPNLRGTSEEPYETVLTPQARPNVLFEAGRAFGSHPDRTVLVELGKLRPFSDIFGRHVVRINNQSERRQDLAMRLRAAGCSVDLDGTDWHSAGDFEGAEGAAA